MTRDPPLARCDLVSARPLMSRLGDASQERLLTTFHLALRETGFLISGRSDTIASFPGFAPLEEHAGIQRRTLHGPVAPRGHLKSIIEKLQRKNRTLRAVNQEVVATNDTLRCTNEELQVSTEELRAANEELESVNAELVARSAEVTRSNDDLTNVPCERPHPHHHRGRRFLTTCAPASTKPSSFSADRWQTPAP